VTLMNNEAELAAVLGHEVGHVAARHSQRRQKAAQKNSLLGLLGAIGSAVLLGDSELGRMGQQLSMQTSQLFTLKFSRKQELEADDLGIQYLARAGYDRRAMGTVLASLAAQNTLDAQLAGRNASIPEWASTHPDPASRVQGALTKAGNTAGGVTNRDTFLARIDGLLYGDDPAQGLIDGSTFIHPELRLSFTAPQGFTMINGARAVSIQGQGGQAQMTLAAYNGNLENYVRSAFTALGGERSTLAPQELQRTTVNGLPAAYGKARVNSGNSQVDVIVFAYEFARDRAYHFAVIAPAGRAATFNPMFQSMRRINASEAGAVVPKKLQVVTVARGDSVASLARRMAYPSAQEERFRVLNALGSRDSLVPGQKVKLVVRAR
jgi:predicted Zn-dependent protease